MKKVTLFIIPPPRQKKPQPFWSTPFQAFSGSGHLDPREESVDTVTTLEIYEVIKPGHGDHITHHPIHSESERASFPPSPINKSAKKTNISWGNPWQIQLYNSPTYQNS